MDSAEEDAQISPSQMRAARAMLGWSREEAATRSRVALITLKRFENEERTPGIRTLEDIVETFEKQGLVFTRNADGEGVYRKRGF